MIEVAKLNRWCFKNTRVSSHYVFQMDKPGESQKAAKNKSTVPQVLLLHQGGWQIKQGF